MLTTGFQSVAPVTSKAVPSLFILASSVCKSLQCLISTLTQGDDGGHLFRLTCSIVLWGGRNIANKYHWRVWGVLAVCGPHWLCSSSRCVSLYDSAIPLLGMNTEETGIERDTCTPVFIIALFTIVRTWKQPRYPSADEWIRKLWYIYTMECYSAIKKNTFESVLMRWMKLEPINRVK